MKRGRQKYEHSNNLKSWHFILQESWSAVANHFLIKTNPHLSFIYLKPYWQHMSGLNIKKKKERNTVWKDKECCTWSFLSVIPREYLRKIGKVTSLSSWQPDLRAEFQIILGLYNDPLSQKENSNKKNEQTSEWDIQVTHFEIIRNPS